MIVAAAALPVFALAACGNDETDRATTSATGTSTGAEIGGAKAPSGPVAETVTVKETDFKLTPANPKVAKGGTVEFVAKNEGQTDHALEVEGPSGEARTETIAPGKSATLKVKLDKPGSYTWYCPIDAHKQKGMVGKITVAGGGGGGATTEPKPDTGSSGSSGGAGYGY